MKFKRNQVVRIGADNELPLRYWGRLARVSTFAEHGILVQPRNKKTPLFVYKNELLPR